MHDDDDDEKEKEEEEDITSPLFRHVDDDQINFIKQQRAWRLLQVATNIQQA